MSKDLEDLKSLASFIESIIPTKVYDIDKLLISWNCKPINEYTSFDEFFDLMCQKKPSLILKWSLKNDKIECINKLLTFVKIKSMIPYLKYITNTKYHIMLLDANPMCFNDDNKMFIYTCFLSNKGLIDVLKYVFERINKKQLIYIACFADNPSTLIDLFNMGLEPNTILLTHFANKLEFLKICLDQGTPISKNSLIYNFQMGNYESVKLLLQYGADITELEILIEGVESGNVEILKLLLENSDYSKEYLNSALKYAKTI